MRSPRPDERPLQIQITGRNILCDTADDRALLAQAKRIVADPSAAGGLSLESLHVIRDTCQRYALGKAQHALKIAIDIRALPGPQ
jgi:hypothetical protein